MATSDYAYFVRAFLAERRFSKIGGHRELL
jgi:hypothetical protein